MYCRYEYLLASQIREELLKPDQAYLPVVTALQLPKYIRNIAIEKPYP